MRAAFLLTGDWQHAEDLLQTALMRCYGRWAQIDGPEAYVRQTMVRLMLGWRRRRWVGEIPTAAPDQVAQDDGMADQVALHTDLLRLLQELGPRQRAVLILRFYEDMSEGEVASLLGVSVGTVKSQTARGLARLRASAPLWSRIEEEAQ
jgi:RNA polymerase sigma-70 factor (sigma-E family)